MHKKVSNEADYFLYANLAFNTDFDYTNWMEAVEKAKQVGVITLYIPNEKYASKNVDTYIEK